MSDGGNVRRPAPIRRRKGSIEIYFVLYLSAIILLLGTTPAKRASTPDELEEVIVGLMASDFQVKARQEALLYSFIPAGLFLDTTGVALRRDTVNTIIAVGSISSVDFSIVSIVDSSTGASVPYDRATLLTDGREAAFQWNPGNEPRDAVYTVTIQGRARPLLRQALRDPALRGRAEEVLRRHPYVYDSVTFSVSLFKIDRPARIVEFRRRDSVTRAINRAGADSLGLPAAPAIGVSSLAGPLSLNVNDAQVLAQPASTWRNRIWINGATSNDVDVTVSPAGIQTSGRGPGYVELAGTTPARGTQVVRVTARRLLDGAMQTVEFPVVATVLPDPQIPARLLRGETYDFDFSVPGMAAGRIVVEVEENGMTVVPRSRGSASVRVTPSTVGKVTFYRYLDGVRISASTADIEEPSLPTLSYVPQDGDAIVTTMSFGKSYQGRENFPRLVIQDGNASNPEPIGSARFDESSKRWVQVWRVRRQDPSHPLDCHAYVLDQRGSSRKSKVYPILVVR